MRSAVSIVLSALTALLAVVWILSLSGPIRLTQGSRWDCFVQGGRLALTIGPPGVIPLVDARDEDRFIPRASSSGGFTTLSVPLWMLFAALITPLVISVVRCARTRPGCCPACGYDLTGNTSGRCPECGTASIDPARTHNGQD